MAKYRVVYELIKQDIFFTEADSPKEAVHKVEHDLLRDPDAYDEWERGPYAEELPDDEIIDLEDGSPVSRYDCTKEDHDVEE